MNSPRSDKVRRVSPDQKAFTLTELLVVIAIVVVLMGLRLPALAAGKTKSKSAQCLNNNRQLSLAWLMYAGDNRDYFLYSSDDGNGTSPYKTADTTKGQQNNYAWTWSKMDFSSSVAYNTDPAADMMLRPMWKYNQNANIYKCPADTSAVSVNGVATPRIRSYSMNFFLGGLGGNAADPSTSGPHFTFYTKLTDLGDTVHSPGAANTFLFIEERFDCINWGNFETDMAGFPQPGRSASPPSYVWDADMPAFYHNFASVISFVDGHSIIHRWQGDAGDTLPPAQGALLGGRGSGTIWNVPYSPDVAWMQNVTVRPH
jgi:prepilin-type N-terminal cleavage/methylation domain-containing protein